MYGGGERVGHTCRCTAEAMLRGGGGGGGGGGAIGWPLALGLRLFNWGWMSVGGES